MIPAVAPSGLGGAQAASASSAVAASMAPSLWWRVVGVVIVLVGFG